MSKSLRSLFAAGVVALAVGVAAPSAGVAAANGGASTVQSTRWVYAWCYGTDGYTVYVSNSVMNVDYYDYSAAVRRWDNARNANNIWHVTRNCTAGTSGDVYYSSAVDADDARYRFANQEQNSYGRNIVWLNW